MSSMIDKDKLVSLQEAIRSNQDRFHRTVTNTLK